MANQPPIYNGPNFNGPLTGTLTTNSGGGGYANSSASNLNAIYNNPSISIDLTQVVKDISDLKSKVDFLTFENRDQSNEIKYLTNYIEYLKYCTRSGFISDSFDKFRSNPNNLYNKFPS